MRSQYLEKNKLPDEPGVYVFRDYKERPLYIGRATSLKDRVKSYFGADLIDTRGPRLVDMVTKAESLTWTETASVLEAILLESNLIKKYQPYYNVDERDDKSSMYVIITNEAWPRVFLVRARDYEQAEKQGTLEYKVKRCFGPFPEVGLIKESLKILRRLFPFRDKKSSDPRHEAFYRALGQSPKNEGNEARKAYLKSIRYLILFFEGESDRVRKEVERDMKKQAKAMQFEQATQTRKLLQALKHINDIALIKRNGNGFAHHGTKTYRIEAFDVAHLSGSNVVGAMTVSINGQPFNAEYRRFKIFKDANNDVAGLVEILSRRLNHQEWTYPDLIVVDGNDVHLRAAESVLKARRISIPVVAVTKDERHKAAALLGNEEITKKYREEIIAVNSEAHRFAITYHRLRRNKGHLL